MPSLSTFNANNFFLRYRFSRTYPGDQSQSSAVEAAEVGLSGYLPGTSFGNYDSRYIIWDAQRRQLASSALAEPDGQLPDILCFQEVENIQAIRTFNQRYLNNHYPYSLLIDSYDPRNIDVGILSRFPLRNVDSYIDEVNAAGDRVFSRDCLVVEVDLPSNDTLTLFINHLKSKFIRRRANETDAEFNDRKRRGHLRRQAQAQRVLDIVRDRMQGQINTALFAVLGDFNDTAESPYLQPLTGYTHLVDILREFRNANDCWTYYWRSRNRVSQIDFILCSRALRDRVQAVVDNDPNFIPHIERQGLGYRELNANNEILPRNTNLVFFEPDEVTPMPPGIPAPVQIDFRFNRYPELFTNWRNNISDHCPIKVWF